MLPSNRSNPALLCSPACGQIEWKRWHSYVLLILVGLGQLFWKAFDFYSQGAETCFMNFIVWRSKEGRRYSICSHIKLVRAQPQWAAGGRSGESISSCQSHISFCRHATSYIHRWSFTAGLLGYIYVSVRLGMCFSPTGRAYLYANEVPVTFKGGCLNSGKGTERALFIWVWENKKWASLPLLEACQCKVKSTYVFSC